MYSKLFQLLLLIELNWTYSLTLLGLSIDECVRIKKTKTKTFIDGLGHRGSVTDREGNEAVYEYP